MSDLVQWNTDLMLIDMTRKLWNRYELAKQSKKHPATINRFLSGECQTAKTAKAIAEALGKNPSRYLEVKRA